MAMISSILCPVDMSGCSREALSYALYLASGTGAHVEVLHVWEIPVVVRPEVIMLTERSSGMSLADLVKLRSEAELREFLAPLDEASRARLSVHLEPGTPARGIIEFAAERGHDLIVLGTHGRTGLPRLFLGSVSERVVRHAGCPVLTVHAGPESAQS